VLSTLHMAVGHHMPMHMAIVQVEMQQPYKVCVCRYVFHSKGCYNDGWRTTVIVYTLWQSVIQHSGPLSKTPQDIKIYKNARTQCNPLIVKISLPLK
jgi:hypothetical protein